MRTIFPLLASLLASPLGGCGRTAVIETRDLLVHEAVLVDADAHVIRVEPDGQPAHGIPRRDIASIDHPGNVALVLGIASSALGGTLFGLGAVGASLGQGQGFLDALLIAGVGAAGLGLGVPLAIDGYGRWRDSTDIVQRRARVSLELTPTGLVGRF